MYGSGQTGFETVSERIGYIDEYVPNIDVSEFLIFADFFFDGFLADVFGQLKIGDAKIRVDDAIFRVQNIVSRLQQELR